MELNKILNLKGNFQLSRCIRDRQGKHHVVVEKEERAWCVGCGRVCCWSVKFEWRRWEERLEEVWLEGCFWSVYRSLTGSA